jgi:4-hydroxybenzoate polyprenyltransferase
MDNKKRLKLVGYFGGFILIATLLLFVFQIVNAIFFWSVMILGALFVYKILPKLKKMN